MNVEAFAARHDIPIQHAEAYAQGVEARRDGRRLEACRAVTPAQAWYRAGWHDRDMLMGNRVTEVA